MYVSERLERFNITLLSLSQALPSLFVVHCFAFLCPLSAGEVLFQMAEVHRQIQIQLEEMVSVWRCWWCC